MTYLEAIFFAEKIKENGVISESFKLLEDGTVVEHTITKLSEEGKNMLEMAIKAMGLQVAKKLEYEADGYDENGNLVYDYARCPVCGHDFEYGINDWGCNYCCECGQKLLWE